MFVLSFFYHFQKQMDSNGRLISFYDGIEIFFLIWKKYEYKIYPWHHLHYQQLVQATDRLS